MMRLGNVGDGSTVADTGNEAGWLIRRMSARAQSRNWAISKGSNVFIREVIVVVVVVMESIVSKKENTQKNFKMIYT